jgi:hypothetical protein
MERSVRVRAENGKRFAHALRVAGYAAVYLGPGTASSSLDGGCCDRYCCIQHLAADLPHEWGSIRTNASGSAAHKVFQACLAGDKTK